MLGEILEVMAGRIPQKILGVISEEIHKGISKQESISEKKRTILMKKYP